MQLSHFWLLGSHFPKIEPRKLSSPANFAARVISAPLIRFKIAKLGSTCEQLDEGRYILVWIRFAFTGQDGNRGVQVRGPVLVARLSSQSSTTAGSACDKADFLAAVQTTASSAQGGKSGGNRFLSGPVLWHGFGHCS